jgi:secondary thiamine-phosphate synthase enzyme
VGKFVPASKSLSRSAPSAVTASTIVSSLLSVRTPGPGFIDLTAEIARFVDETGAREGAVTLFIRHTSASLTIQENADPSVLDDLTTALGRLAPESAGWRHDTEGPDDMPAHIKTMLTAVSLHIPVLQGKLALGTWQAVYLIEHRNAPHRREVVLQFAGQT